MTRLERTIVTGAVLVAGGALLGRAAETAEAALARFIEATGGRAAYDKIRNRVVHATMEISGQGIKLELTVYAAMPNLFYSEVNSELTGKIEQGCDGQVAWSKSVAQGPQLLQGEQRETLVREARLDKFINWREVYGEARLAGNEEVDGKRCHKVVLTPKTGRPVTLFFDEANGLLVRTEMVMVTEAGEIPVRFRLQDYREADGVKLAYRTVVELLGQERVMVVNRVEQNVDLPADRFALPADVKALLRARK